MLAIVLNIPVMFIAGPAAALPGTFAILLPFMFYEFNQAGLGLVLCLICSLLVNNLLLGVWL